MIARSFARIHETNLKQQGVLALTFHNPGDYALVRRDDNVSILGLSELAPGKPVYVHLVHSDGSSDTFQTKHTMTAEQIEWFKAGSALNYIRSQREALKVAAEQSCCPLDGSGGEHCRRPEHCNDGPQSSQSPDSPQTNEFFLVRWFRRFVDWIRSF